MFGILFSVRSLTYGQRGIKVLQKRGIGASLQRSPKRIAANGCGYVIRLRERDAKAAAAVLTEVGILYTGIWRETAVGEYERVVF